MAASPRYRNSGPSLREKAARKSGLARSRALRQIRRARSRLMVCFWTLPLYMIGVWLLLEGDQEVTILLAVYVLIWSGFGLDMARRVCPHCGQQFFVRNIVLNVLTHKCVHCGTPMREIPASNHGNDDNYK